MRVEHRHDLGRDGARARIERAVDDLVRRTPPPGVEVTDPRHAWSGDQLEFSFKAKRGFLGATIAGTLDVHEDHIVLDAALPGLLTTFVGEDQVRRIVAEQLEKLLA